MEDVRRGMLLSEVLREDEREGGVDIKVEKGGRGPIGGG